MLYISQILDKQLYHGNQLYGKVIDVVAHEVDKTPTINQLIVKRAGKKIAVDATKAIFNHTRWEIHGEIQEVPYSDKEFLLNEDLLDKQVIDVNGRRLVRVNDILIKENGKLKVDGIDIGFSGILRRLGISHLFVGRSIILPWSVIEAFDYETGTIKIKLTQHNLNSFQPAELADILEEVGTKERLGIVANLDAEKAASAIEEADEETQTAILEQIPSQTLRKIVNRMHLSEIADIIRDVNPFRSKQILEDLGSDKAKKLQRLLIYADDVAGGLMDPAFVKQNGKKTVGETLAMFVTERIWPETIIIVDDNDSYLGIINSKDFLHTANETQLAHVLSHNYAVTQDTDFTEMFRLFTEYNLRALAVVDKERKVMGVITIDIILSLVSEEEEKEDAV